jgi:hypothetical protein
MYRYFLAPQHINVFIKIMKWNWLLMSFQNFFLGSEPSLEVSRQNIRKKIQRWIDNQHLATWHSFRNTQRRTRNLFRALVQLKRPDFCPLMVQCPRVRNKTPDNSNLMNTTLLSLSSINLIVNVATSPTMDIKQ